MASTLTWGPVSVNGNMLPLHAVPLSERYEKNIASSFSASLFSGPFFKPHGDSTLSFHRAWLFCGLFALRRRHAGSLRIAEVLRRSEGRAKV